MDTILHIKANWRTSIVSCTFHRKKGEREIKLIIQKLKTIPILKPKNLTVSDSNVNRKKNACYEEQLKIGFSLYTNYVEDFAL